MHLKFLTLVSNCNKEYFLNNDSTSFTNLLPAPLYPTGGNVKVFIRLKSLIISYKFVDQSVPDNEINIYIQQLAARISNDDFNTKLITYHLSESNFKENYLYHEFEHSPYLPIQIIPVTHLSILITDKEDNILVLPDSVITTIHLEIADMDLSGQFTLTCLSKASEDIYPTNSLSNFRVRMPQSLELGGWEAALLNISLPDDVKLAGDVSWTISLMGPNEKNILVVKKSKKFEFNLMNYGAADNDAFVNDIIKKLNDDTDISPYIEISRTADNKATEWKLKAEHDFFITEHGRVSLYFGKDFCRALGHLTDIDGGVTYISHQDGPAQLSYKMPGTPNISLVRPDTIAMLYCNIIGDNAIASQLHPLLQIIPINRFKDISMYEPQHLTFHPCVDRAFTEIHFSIHQPNGQPLGMDTDNPEHGVNITLLFRPIKAVRGNQTCESGMISLC